MATVDDIFKLLTAVNKTTLGRIESEIKAMNTTTLGRIEGEVNSIGAQVAGINNSIPGFENDITDIKTAVTDISQNTASLPNAISQLDLLNRDTMYPLLESIQAIVKDIQVHVG